MNGWTFLIISSSFIILYYSAVTSAQATEQTSWSQWTCFNSTIASRNRTVQNCTDVEYIDSVTNMTMTNTSCDNVTEIDRRTVAQTSWGMWGLWNSTEVPMCGAGVRSRQRVCTNTTLVYCDIDCTFGTNNTDNQCCVVSNVWSTWTSWSQATNIGPCPDNRTRTRSCVANTTVTGIYPGQPDCAGTCTLTTEETQTQKILTSRCESPPAIITELTPWSQWTCFNDTVASRNRTVQRCADMEEIDSVTNMTMTNTLCDNLIDIKRRTDVVSANTWSSWAPMPPCSTTGTITQNRTSSCQTADFQCSSICTGGRATQRTTTVPLCCAQQTYSEWTTWAPGCSPSDPVSQTRQQVVLPCDQNIQCETDCPNITQMRIIAQTSWGMWGLWNSTEVPMCGAGLRSRQRVCTNTTLVYCNIDCTFGTNDTDNQCCVVSNVWSTWTGWSQATNIGPCPDTRTRTRLCLADTNMTGMYPGQPDCDGTCTLNKEQPERQPVATRRCDEIGNLATSTGDDNEFPTWAIGLISAIVVILVVAGFVAITIGGRCLTRRRAYYIEEVTAATQKEYNKMNEGVPPSTYQPTTSFTEGIPGTTATDSNNFIEPFEENPL